MKNRGAELCKVKFNIKASNGNIDLFFCRKKLPLHTS